MKYLRLATLLSAAAAISGLPSSAQEYEDQKSTPILRIHEGVDLLVGKADTLAAAGRYAEALEIYADAQRHPNSLVPVDVKSGAPARYMGVLEFSLRRIAAWPPEGRAAARRFADPIAGQAFRAARAGRDAQALEEIARRYPHSSFADDALATLGNLHLESGRAAEAVTAFERLLSLQDSDLPKPVVFVRLGVAYARAGRAKSLESLIDRCEREADGATVVLGDREVPIVPALRSMARTVRPPAPDPLAPPAWEMIQGSPTGVRVAEAAELGSRHWSARLDDPRFQTDEDQWGGFTDARPDSSYRPVVPAVSDGIAYFHTEYVVQAWNLYALATEPLWSHRLPEPPGNLMFEDRLVHATTVSDGRVYANLITWRGQNEVQSSYIRVKYPFPKRALFALDAYSGKVLWRLGGQPRADRFEDGLSFSTPPTPAGGYLYVGAISQPHPTDPFQHHVLCIEPSTGRVVWSTFVASGGTEINLFGNSTRESLGSPVSVDGESVYYGTNHGAIGAVDRTTGRLRWVSRYFQLPVRPTRRTDIQRADLAWLPSAPVLTRGLAVFTPTDSQWLYALDAASGELLWKRERYSNRVIGGCDGNLLLLAGSEGAEWIDLSRGGKLVGRYSPAGLNVTGRPVLTNEGVFLPTREGLYRFSMETGAESGFFVGSWRGSNIRGGNLVVAEGALVIADSSTVEAFVNRTSVDAAVEAELKKHPDRSDLVYRAALRLLQSGKDDRALELLSRVIELTTGSLRPAEIRLERAARKRLFAVSKSLGLSALAGGKHQEAAASFQRAAAASPDAASSVEITALLADVAEARGDYPAAIGEYQQLLGNSGDEFVGGVRVFDLSRAAISKILVLTGRDPYKSFEEEAERRLRKAQGVGTPGALLEVYRSHPNSLAAETGMLAAAQLQSSGSRSDDAISTLRMFLREFPGSGRTLEAQTALVLELEKRSRFVSAAAVLRKMAAAGAKWEVTVGERKVPVAEFVESRLARDEYKRAEAPAPEMKLSGSLKRSATYVEKEFPTGPAVLKLEGPALPADASLLFLNYGSAIRGIDPAAGTATWKLPTDLPVRSAFVHDGSLLLCSETSISRVNPKTGAVEWKHAPGSTLKGFGLSGAMLCYLTTDPRSPGSGTLVALDPARGAVAWSQGFPGTSLSTLIPAEDHIAVVTLAPHQILLYDAETGRAAPPVPLLAKSAGMRIVSTQRGILVLHSEEGGLQAFELPSGSRKWWNRLEGWTVSLMTSSPAGLLIGGSERGQPRAILLDHRTGKLRGVTESLDGIPTAPASMNDRAAAFAVRRGNRDLGARCVDLRDSRLKSIWSVDAATDDLQTVPLLAGEQAAVLRLSATPEGKFEWAVDVLDSAGTRLQNIRGESPLERPPSIALANAGLILLVDNKVELYR